MLQELGVLQWTGNQRLHLWDSHSHGERRRKEGNRIINQLPSDTLGAVKELKRDSMVLWPGVWSYFGWRDLPKAFLRRWRLGWDPDDTKQSPTCISVWHLVVRFEVMVEEKLLGRGSSKLQMPWAWRAQGLVDLGGWRGILFSSKHTGKWWEVLTYIFKKLLWMIHGESKVGELNCTI